MLPVLTKSGDGHGVIGQSNVVENGTYVSRGKNKKTRSPLL